MSNHTSHRGFRYREPKGRTRDSSAHSLSTSIYMPVEIFDQIDSMARRYDIAFSRQVVSLLRASLRKELE